MDTSTVVKKADLTQAAKQLNGEPVPAHLASLPEETHIITGSLVGHGATELATVNAKLSAKVVQLVRNSAGGVDYQLAIFVSEPAPLPVAPVAPAEDPDFLKAVDYFMEKGLSETDARKQVNQFGVPRVLAAQSKEMDDKLAKVVAGETKPD